MAKETITSSPAGEFIMFASGDGKVRVECRFESDTIWLSQATMAELYDKDVRTINEHLINIFSEGELAQHSTIRKFRIVRQEGKRQVSREIDHYNLEAILAVGYRVRSSRGTQFRQWATQTLQEYLIKGFVMDDERLKNPPVGSSAVPDYFDEMLERIRDIRASERRVYLRVREIFALAADYQPSLKETTQFFQTIQNKLHFACTGHTAAELIHQRADASQLHMGLTNYKGEEVHKCDVTVAKNYLTQDEVNELNRVVNMWLDFAEDQARRRQQVFLRDWQDKLDQFLQFNDRKVLQDTGKVSKKMAAEKAQAEYSQFAEQQRRLKEAEGEKDIAGLLQWKTEPKK
ncbi:virulence RhuM family protein [Klebsiella aerogenes]|uniref:virulence RhuM family protein n=1 Tax=Klebsiella aerogenes TaxID=548 RepID=UPI002DBF2814|nr:RhuM family protein [Klebsiella aerogenes]MEB7534196.1 virulence RhuM family protein [Klebsiella aerogenes]